MIAPTTAKHHPLGASLEEHVRYTLASSHPDGSRIIADVSPAPNREANPVGDLTVSVDGQKWSVQVLSLGPPTLVLIAGKPYEVLEVEADTYQCVGSSTLVRALRSTHHTNDVAAADPRFLVSPMPGRVVKVSCQPGAPVAKGSPLVVLEAMKMENELCAPFDARVRNVFVDDGQSVERGARLVELDEVEPGQE